MRARNLLLIAAVLAVAVVAARDLGLWVGGRFQKFPLENFPPAGGIIIPTAGVPPMTPDDLTRTSPPDGTRDQSDAAPLPGLVATSIDTTRLRPPPPADPEAGTVIAGKYRLTEKVGEGGMGSVWAANQTEPVKRKVAVKLIKAGMDSKVVLARFDAERQALAVMDHPNIAKVLDGGVWSPSPLEGEGLGVRGNVPYFVMELVKGVPITEYCDARNRLTPEGSGWNCSCPVCQADPARAPEGGDPPRPQAVQRPGGPVRRQAGAQGDRLRGGQGDRRRC